MKKLLLLVVLLAALFGVGRAEGEGVREEPLAPALISLLAARGVVVEGVVLEGWVPLGFRARRDLPRIFGACFPGVKAVPPRREGSFFLSWELPGEGEVTVARGSHLLVRVRLRGATPRAGLWEERLRSFLGALGGGAKVYLNVEGKVERVEASSEEKWAAAFLRSLGARAVSSQRMGELFSTTGFVPWLPGWVVAGQERLNLHLVLRSLPGGKTWRLYLGSPLLSVEF